MNLEEALEIVRKIESNTNSLAAEYPHDYNSKYANEWITELRSFLQSQHDENERLKPDCYNELMPYEKLYSAYYKQKEQIADLREEVERLKSRVLLPDKVMLEYDISLPVTATQIGFTYNRADNVHEIYTGQYHRAEHGTWKFKEQANDEKQNRQGQSANPA